MRGYFGIGIYNGKDLDNIGTLWRSANILGASFIFTIWKRYPNKQPGDTMQTPRHVPLYEYETWDKFKKNTPRLCKIIAIELDKNSKPIRNYKHPEQAIYILGAEDYGIPEEYLKECDEIIQLPGDYCMNVSVSGSIVMYDRVNKYTKTST